MQPSPHCTVTLIYFSVVSVLEFNKRGFVTVVQKIIPHMIQGKLYQFVTTFPTGANRWSIDKVQGSPLLPKEAKLYCHYAAKTHNVDREN